MDIAPSPAKLRNRALNGHGVGAMPMTVVTSAATQAVGRLPPLVAVAVGVAALILVVITELWGPVSHFGRLAHEGAHAMVGSCLDAQVLGVRLDRKKRTGGTDLRLVPGSGTDFLSAVVGYLGPSGFGLAAAALIAHDQIVPVLWTGVVLLAILLLCMRGVFSIALVIGIGFALFTIARSQNAGLEAVTAYGLSWLLLLSGVRSVLDRRAEADDAYALRKITGLPRGLWYRLWLIGTMAAVVWGSTMLV
jgi:Peptidase M50B-like